MNILINKKTLALTAIVALSLFLRIYNLDKIPNGFANDEAAISYQAYSISQTGRDTWNNKLPVFSFKDFGEHLPPFSVYAIVPFIKIMGLNEFAARLPFALSAVISTIVIYFLTIKLFNNKNLALLASLIFVLSPLNIGWSRFVYEGNFGALFYLLAITFYVYAQKKPYLHPISIIFFGLTFTTYHIFYLITPITLLIYYLPLTRKLITHKKLFVICFVIGLIISIYALQIVNSGSGRERFRQVSLFYRGDLIHNLNIKRTVHWLKTISLLIHIKMIHTIFVVLPVS